MQINKSDLLNQLSNNFPNFLKKDLAKFVEVTLEKIKKSLRDGERVELRDIFTFEAKKYNRRNARNPRTNEKIIIPEKKIIRFKLSKKWQKVINENE